MLDLEKLHRQLEIEDRENRNRKYRDRLRTASPASIAIEELSGKKNELDAAIDELLAGGPQRLERALAKQAVLLNGAFESLLAIAATHQFELDTLDRYISLALKAQSQSRRTIQALSEIKNPKKSIFAKSLIQKQVNQFLAQQMPVLPAIAPSTGEEFNAPLEPGAERETISANQKMETLGEVDRPKNKRGKRKIKTQQPETRPQIWGDD